MKEDYQTVLDYARQAARRSSASPRRPRSGASGVLDRLRLSPLYKWVYETASRDSFVSIEKAEGAWLRAEVLEQGGTLEELPVVPREPRQVRGLLRRLAPGALEAGCNRVSALFLISVG